jgi:hypothetical protein
MFSRRKVLAGFSRGELAECERQGAGNSVCEFGLGRRAEILLLLQRTSENCERCVTCVEPLPQSVTPSLYAGLAVLSDKHTVTYKP